MRSRFQAVDRPLAAEPLATMQGARIAKQPGGHAAVVHAEPCRCAPRRGRVAARRDCPAREPRRDAGRRPGRPRGSRCRWGAGERTDLRVESGARRSRPGDRGRSASAASESEASVRSPRRQAVGGGNAARQRAAPRRADRFGRSGAVHHGGISDRRCAAPPEPSRRSVGAAGRPSGARPSRRARSGPRRGRRRAARIAADPVVGDRRRG